MSHYQEIVGEYLKAKRSIFLNPEFLLQLDEGEGRKGRFWWVDILAINLAEESVYLCEVTYARWLAGLVRRLSAWEKHWDELRLALQRDAHILPHWPVTPWVFLPEELTVVLDAKLSGLSLNVRRTALERTVPWRYCTWDRRSDDID